MVDLLVDHLVVQRAERRVVRLDALMVALMVDHWAEKKDGHLAGL